MISEYILMNKAYNTFNVSRAQLGYVKIDNFSNT